MDASLLAAVLVLTAFPDGPGGLPTDAPTLPPAAVQTLPPPLPPPPDRAGRIAIELLVSSAAGVGVGAVGGYVGCLASQSSNGQTCSTGTIAAVGLTSYGLTLAAVVPLAGNALGGDGSPWAAWLGEAVGLGGGLALAQGNPKNAMLFCAPLMLVGAVAGYELSAGWAHAPAPSTPATPAVAVAPVRAGAVLAVGGHF